MKHTLTFLVLLALILSIGYYSAGFSELTLKNNENKSIKLTRDDSESNAVFFSGSENGFDPMSLVVPCSPDQETAPDIRTDIAAAVIAVLSRYTPKNEYIKGTEIPIEMAMKRSSNNYIYTEGYSYINPYGDERVLDCILDADDFDIVYIRYRSAQESEPDPIQAKNALEKFSGFSDDVEKDYDMINDFMSNLSLLISDSGYADYWDLINNYGLIRYVSADDESLYNGEAYNESIDWNDTLIKYDDNGQVSYDPTNDNGDVSDKNTGKSSTSSSASSSNTSSDNVSSNNTDSYSYDSTTEDTGTGSLADDTGDAGLDDSEYDGNIPEVATTDSDE